MKNLHKEDGFYLDFPEYDSIWNFLQETCIRYRESVAFSYMDECKSQIDVTYGQFMEDIRRAACEIQHRYPGAAHIGMVCRNSYECIVLFYGIIAAGKAAVMVESGIREEELYRLMDKTDTSVIVIPKAYSTEQSQRTEVTYTEILEAAYNRDEMTKLPEVKAQDTAFILFTSGTTGERHGVVLSNRNMAESIRGGCIYRLYDKQPSLLLVLPLYHMYGLVVLLCHLAIGSRFCLNSSLKVIQKDLLRFQPQIMECVPMMLEFLYKKINLNIDKAGKRKQFELMCRISNFLDKLHIHIARKAFQSVLQPLGGNLEFIICGGAFLDKEILEFFRTIGIVVYEGYGLTETATFVTVNTDRYHQYGSVGILTPYNDVRIEEDEIQIRGTNIMQEYYGEPELTREAFDGEWFRTGDLGYFDEDGYLYLTGRKKNLLILSNGQNVSPELIENDLVRSDWIEEVVVSEQKGHIHASVYTSQIENVAEDVLKAKIKETIDETNRHHGRERYVESFELRQQPFDKTVTMKIRRQ